MDECCGGAAHPPRGLIDRRAFTRLLSAAGLGAAGMSLVGCGGDSEILTPTTPPSQDPPQPPYPSAADRAIGVAKGLVSEAEPVSDGLRWAVVDGGAHTYPEDLYSGQAGVLSFLAEVHRFRPDPELEEALRLGGAWLRARPPANSNALYEGNAGRAWAFVSLHEALGGPSTWLDEALGLAAPFAQALDGLPGDLINGWAGRGLFLLRLYRVTGDARWLDDARTVADRMLETAVSSGDGIKFPSFTLADGRTVFYTGMSHGSAGAGYFLSRLADALPESEGAGYVASAMSVAAWLAGIRRTVGQGVNWYRREPDQTDQHQIQWCHGAPGIGIFHAELFRVTGIEAYLETALLCATHVFAQGGQHAFPVQCHGVAGNAELFIKLYRTTGHPEWMERARAFEEIVWSRRYRDLYYPCWPSGDGNNRNNPGLMTGTAGVGWFYLQLAMDGEFGGPITD